MDEKKNTKKKITFHSDFLWFWLKIGIAIFNTLTRATDQSIKNSFRNHTAIHWVAGVFLFVRNCFAIFGSSTMRSFWINRMKVHAHNRKWARFWLIMSCSILVFLFKKLLFIGGNSPSIRRKLLNKHYTRQRQQYEKQICLAEISMAKIKETNCIWNQALFSHLPSIAWTFSFTESNQKAILFFSLLFKFILTFRQREIYKKKKQPTNHHHQWLCVISSLSANWLQSFL